MLSSGLYKELISSCQLKQLGTNSIVFKRNLYVIFAWLVRISGGLSPVIVVDSSSILVDGWSAIVRAKQETRDVVAGGAAGGICRF